MRIGEKIRIMRSIKGWTQEKMAKKLGLATTNSYAKIERGETEPTISKLEQIAKVLEINLTDLMNLSEKSIFQIGDNSANHSYINTATNELKDCQHEVEKLRMMLEQKEEQISLLKRQVALLEKQNQYLEQNNSFRLIE